MEQTDTHKKHRSKQAGTKAEKKKALVIGIVGPPKVGKTTLLHCIVKNFTKQRLSNVQGPVTVVSGKKRRLTLIECSNDINMMIDVAKVADLVLLLVDASFGFEMEIFEFLNICQVHGFPRVMGVLTHLDMFRDNKRIRKTKKRLKNRFWTEIYQGAKLFYLSGMVNDEYQRMEIHNLCRFISVMKFRPLTWRSSHPYILADRVEDITNQEEIRKNAKCDRRITFYGYVRGIALKNQQSIHLAGVGDFRIASAESLPDPCPTPDMEKRRSLTQKERFIYAPMSGVGGIIYDKDAVYIDVGGSHSLTEQSEEMTPINELVSTLMEADPMDAKMSTSQLSVFRDSAAITNEEAEDDDQEVVMPQEELVQTQDGRVRRKAVFGAGDESDDEDDDDGDDDDSGVEGEEEEESDDDDQEVTPGPPKKKAKLQKADDQDEEMAFADSDDDLEVDFPADGGESDGEDEEDAVEDSDDADSEAEVGDGSSDEDAEEDEEGPQWKLNLTEKAAAAFKKRRSQKINYHKLIYGQSDNDDEEKGDEEEEEDELGGLFRVLKKKSELGKEQHYDTDLTDCSRFTVNAPHDWALEEVREQIQDCFVTGAWDKSEDAVARLQEDDDLYGDFEDLETGEKHMAQNIDSDGEQEGSGADDDEKEGDADSEKKKTKAEMTATERRLEKKRKMKEMFNAEYDTKGDDQFYTAWKAEMEEQAKLNRNEFENLSEEMRQQMEGFRPGLYVRVEVDGIPCEFIQHFNPNYPVVLGGLTSVEENIGYVQARFKKHRWYKKILKTRNPLIMSLGWRRFQTIPLYSVQDHNMRHRLLKYTPEHMHCHASFWGPITPQGSGILAVESVSDVSRGFRVAGTGVVLELDKSLQIVKKLKLTGTPSKIFKKTAFIQGMFNSPLEVAKFEGATIRTVSGLRGQIKKALRAPPGAFRATFEDRILLSDIVFVRTWYPVQVPQFYNPVTTLLLSDKSQWQGMRTIGQLRHDRGIPVPQNKDSLYKPVARKVRQSAPLVIPRALQKDLPFKVTPKNLGPSSSQTIKRVPVIREPRETKIAKMVHMLKTVHEHRMRTQHAQMRQRAHDHQKKMSKQAEERERKQKDARHELYRVLGKMERAKAKGRGKPRKGS
nr:hypothetical protein BaRGS_013933 [Batillaria attramentaria]